MNLERIAKLNKNREEIRSSFIVVFIAMVAGVGFMLEYNRTFDPLAAGYGFLFMLFILTLIAYTIGTMLNYLSLKNKEEKEELAPS